MQQFLKYSAAILVIFSVFACQSSEKKNKKQSAGGPVLADVYEVKPRVYERKHKLTGTLLANEEVNLATESSGKISHINFKEGQRVPKGRLLLELHNDDLKAQVKKATLQVELLAKELTRKKKLLKIEGISQEEYDQAENAHLTAEAELALSRANLDKTRIYAPFAGQIGLRNVSEGEFVANNTMVAKLQQTDPLKIDFDLPEEYAQMVQQNMQVSFTISASDSAYQAQVYAVEPGINPATRTLKLRAIFNNKKANLLPGTFANITLTLAKLNDALLIPTTALIPEINQTKVLVMENGKVAERIVKTAEQNEREVLILSGLKPGDKVITSGLLQLKAGMPVGVKTESAVQ